MANFLRKTKEPQQNPNANFGVSKDIAYWAEKHNLCPLQFKKAFETSGSIAQAIQLCVKRAA
jgi:hypothetical protein